MLTELAPGDPRLGLTGHAELVPGKVGELPWRLPVRRTRGLIQPRLLERAMMAAGVRLDLETDATAFAWDVAVAAAVSDARPSRPSNARPPAPFDVVVDGSLVARRRIEGRGVLAVEGLANTPKRVQIWLPQLGYTELGQLRLPPGAQVEAAVPRPRWIGYGSSITHCTGADGPTETWPALVAAAHDWDLRCLGFGGECHLDQVVARFIRDCPADLISLCLGANVYGRTTFSARSFVPAVTGFVQTIRDGHPDVPLVVQTPIHYDRGEDVPNAVGVTVADLRELLAEAVDALRDSGYGDIHLIDGRAAFGPADAALLADGLHPNPEGYRLMATRLAPLLGDVATRTVDRVAG
ncbi:GDSL-type esterase/lipase family protein [Actinophytocola oryzae]|uniref:Lysophospholipase L1-like esterase n=1 Tax=Actinophytocola oryzae TaxID=502181 RepID=A0A4V3FT53_9PSEU|nr:GDSL-type esterase/lipase family protein [Actinophytocola oryzae]TDV49971.1 lysophospholipase L1-like esterase [Actinophytocola oryzae]